MKIHCIALIICLLCGCSVSRSDMFRTTSAPEKVIPLSTDHSSGHVVFG